MRCTLQGLTHLRSMAEQRNIRIRAPSVDHTVILDPFPELWTEILTRVPHADR